MALAHGIFPSLLGKYGNANVLRLREWKLRIVIEAQRTRALQGLVEYCAYSHCIAAFTASKSQCCCVLRAWRAVTSGANPPTRAPVRLRPTSASVDKSPQAKCRVLRGKKTIASADAGCSVAKWTLFLLGLAPLLLRPLLDCPPLAPLRLLAVELGEPSPLDNRAGRRGMDAPMGNSHTRTQRRAGVRGRGGGGRPLQSRPGARGACGRRGGARQAPPSACSAGRCPMGPLA
jgi:hypothetical protein